MNARGLVVLAGSILVAGLPGHGHAEEPDASLQRQVSHLLTFTEQSGCDFYRNGSRYDSIRAAAHLKSKYAALRRAGRISSIDAFIDEVASVSSLTGRRYEVVCPGRQRTGTADWLREELAREQARDGRVLRPGPG